MLMQEGKWMQRKEMRKMKMDGGVRRSEARDLPKSKRFWERTGKMTVNAKSIPSRKKWGKLAERMQMSWESEHRHYSHKGNYRSRSRAYSEDSRLSMSLGSILKIYDGVFQNVLKKIVNRPKFRGMIWRFFLLNQNLKIFGTEFRKLLKNSQNSKSNGTEFRYSPDQKSAFPCWLFAY